MRPILLVLLITMGACTTDGDDGNGGDIGKGDDSSTSRDPFDPRSCAGTTISKAKLATIRADEISQAGALWLRERTCGDPSSCGAWRKPQLIETVSFTRQSDLVFRAAADIADDDGKEQYEWKFQMPGPTPDILVWATFYRYSGSNITMSAYLEDSAVVMTDHCVRATGSWLNEIDEIEVAWISSY